MRLFQTASQVVSTHILNFTKKRERSRVNDPGFVVLCRIVVADELVPEALACNWILQQARSATSSAPEDLLEKGQ